MRISKFTKGQLLIGVVLSGLAMVWLGTPQQTSASSGSISCSNTPAAGDITGGYADTSHTVATLTNHSTKCSYKVGIASYKAYLPYSTGANKDWIYTQTYYASKTTTLKPGKTVTLKVAVPSCAWQTDIFWGSVIKKFSPTQLYSVQGRLIDGGWYETSRAVCQAKPTPTPTITATPVVTATPAKLPTTGPGDIFAVALIGLVGGLVSLKYWRLS